MLLFLILYACAPYGRINTPMGSERLRSAWYMEINGGLGILLSSSEVSCSLPTSENPEEISKALQDFYLAINREGSQLMAFILYNYNPRSWEGYYPISDAPDIDALDEVDPRVAQATYRSVDEARLEYQAGLYREYEPTDYTYVAKVEGPGHVTVEKYETNQTLEGWFSLDALDVSGTFDAQPCESDNSEIIELLMSI